MSVSICISENTKLPTLLAIKAKGFTITISYTEIDGKIDKTGAVYEADRGDCGFSANNPEQLLGLIAMWEVRGDDWRYYDSDDFEMDIYDELIESALVYDPEGNIIED